MAKPKNPVREAARKAGDQFYEGPPCLRGHTRKYVKNAVCVECAILRANRWVTENAERRRENHRAWYERNQDQIVANSAEWRRDNPERFRASLKRWFAENPEQARLHQRRRRARKRNAPGSHTAKQVRAILAIQNRRCAYCSEIDNLHLDHATPLSRGGSDALWNLQWLCAFHNMSKNAKTDPEYRAEIGLPAAIWPGMHLFLLIFAI
jgi:5-methylcytosine-specific restriction endonuclease McrA